MLLNPFINGDVVSPEKFVGRENEIRRLVGRIMNGSSSLLVGDPRIGKTSLLKYLYAPQNIEHLYGEAGTRLCFCYLNAHTFGDNFGVTQFWQQATVPLYENVIKPNICSSIKSAYEKCNKNKFSDYPLLNNLFEKLNTADWRLVLLIDEFDVILEHSKLNTKEFLGHLRTLTSHNSLSCIAAARQSLTQINDKTNGYADGSPYFNTLNSVTLSTFSNKETDELLEWAGERFTLSDRNYLVNLTGKHPYLLQAAAYELWEAYIEIPDNADKRYRQSEKRLHDPVSSIFNNMWKLWPPEMRMAFTGIGLPYMTLNPRVNKHNLLKDLKNMNAELNALQSRGLIISDEKSGEKWQVSSSLLLWWLADQIAREVRDELSCRAWLQKQQIDHFLVTREHEKKWIEALRSVGEILMDGTKTLIEATAKGFGEAITKQP